MYYNIYVHHPLATTFGSGVVLHFGPFDCQSDPMDEVLDEAVADCGSKAQYEIWLSADKFGRDARPGEVLQHFKLPSEREQEGE